MDVAGGGWASDDAASVTSVVVGSSDTYTSDVGAAGFDDDCDCCGARRSDVGVLG